MNTTLPLPSRRAPRDPASDAGADGRVRRRLLLGAVVGVEAVAVKGVAGGGSSRGAHLTAAGRLRNAQ